MKKINLFCLVLLSHLLVSTQVVFAEEKKKISHVVMVWLKQPGNQQQRDAFVKASESLPLLPGVISRHTGVVRSSNRTIVDDTFDAAVTVTFESEADLKAYLNSPAHKKILKEKIKPLVNRVVAYDFISQ